MKKIKFILLLSLVITTILLNGLVFAEVDIKIIEPKDGSIMEEEYIDIKGNISLTGENIIVKIFMIEEYSQIDNNGNFEFKDISLYDGENYIGIGVYDGEKYLGDRQILVHYYDPEIPQAEITPEKGGIVRADDSSHPLYGAAIEIPARALKYPSRVTIYRATTEEHGASPESYIPNLKYDKIPVGPSIYFNCRGEKFLKPVTLTLPIDVNLLPKGSSINDVIVFAESYEGWIQFPVIKRTNNLVKIKVNELFYNNFVPVVEEK